MSKYSISVTNTLFPYPYDVVLFDPELEVAAAIISLTDALAGAVRASGRNSLDIQISHDYFDACADSDQAMMNCYAGVISPIISMSPNISLAPSSACTIKLLLYRNIFAEYSLKLRTSTQPLLRNVRAGVKVGFEMTRDNIGDSELGTDHSRWNVVQLRGDNRQEHDSYVDVDLLHCRTWWVQRDRETTPLPPGMLLRYSENGELPDITAAFDESNQIDINGNENDENEILNLKSLERRFSDDGSRSPSPFLFDPIVLPTLSTPEQHLTVADEKLSKLITAADRSHDDDENYEQFSVLSDLGVKNDMQTASRLQFDEYIPDLNTGPNSNHMSVQLQRSSEHDAKGIDPTDFPPIDKSVIDFTGDRILPASNLTDEYYQPTQNEEKKGLNRHAREVHVPEFQMIKLKPTPGRQISTVTDRDLVQLRPIPEPLETLPQSLDDPLRINPVPSTKPFDNEWTLADTARTQTIEQQQSANSDLSPNDRHQRGARDVRTDEGDILRLKPTPGHVPNVVSDKETVNLRPINQRSRESSLGDDVHFVKGSPVVDYGQDNIWGSKLALSPDSRSGRESFWTHDLTAEKGPSPRRDSIMTYPSVNVADRLPPQVNVEENLRLLFAPSAPDEANVSVTALESVRWRQSATLDRTDISEISLESMLPSPTGPTSRAFDNAMEPRTQRGYYGRSRAEDITLKATKDTVADNTFHFAEVEGLSNEADLKIPHSLLLLPSSTEIVTKVFFCFCFI